VEREGVSFSHPARFMLIGTMNPEEGELRPQLLDRFALCVDVEGITEENDRIEIVKRYLEYESDPHRFIHKWKDEENRLGEYITIAQSILPEVTYTDDIIKLITSIAITMNVDGHRADIAMLKTGRTIAAFHHRKEVTSDDIREAAELVLPHRMRRKPFQEPKIDNEKLEDAIRNHNNNQPQSQQQTSAEQYELKKKTMNLINSRVHNPTTVKK